ncbi:MAG: hypothetical protein QME96_13470, partial [Myxococcota bacterium]|nr:hypothetical protein [Myxococcota bacterium]
MMGRRGRPPLPCLWRDAGGALLPAVVARLGMAPDRVLAADLGVSPFTVRWWRRALGVASWRASVSRAGKHEVYTASSCRLSEEDLRSDEPHAAVARRSGLSRERVRQLRARLGLSPRSALEHEQAQQRHAEQQQARRERNDLRVAALRAILPDLGVASDNSLALRTGVAPRVVARIRRALGIAPASQR